MSVGEGVVYRFNYHVKMRSTNKPYSKQIHHQVIIVLSDETTLLIRRF